MDSPYHSFPGTKVIGGHVFLDICVTTDWSSPPVASYPASPRSQAPPSHSFPLRAVPNNFYPLSPPPRTLYIRGLRAHCIKGPHRRRHRTVGVGAEPQSSKSSNSRNDIQQHFVISAINHFHLFTIFFSTIIFFLLSAIFLCALRTYFDFSIHEAIIFLGG